MTTGGQVMRQKLANLWQWQPRLPLPTDSRARQNKVRKKAEALALEEGEEMPKPMMKKCKIEDHNDDCGENLDSVTDNIDEF